jgi:hypothetical protein
MIHVCIRFKWGEEAYGNEEYYEEGMEGEGQYEEGAEGYPGGDEQPQNIPPEIAPDVSGTFLVRLPPVRSLSLDHGQLPFQASIVQSHRLNCSFICHKFVLLSWTS